MHGQQNIKIFSYLLETWKEGFAVAKGN